MSCPVAVKHVIEETICNTNVKNDSSHNVLVQFYMNNNSAISRVSLSKNEESSYYGQSNDYTFDYSNPNEQIKKVIIIDTDTYKILKRINDVNEVFKLDYADDNYGIGARFEYYMFDFTDELFKD
jgi:hypothetical protein